jgi:hypothetical protein
MVKKGPFEKCEEKQTAQDKYNTLLKLGHCGSSAQRQLVF